VLPLAASSIVASLLLSVSADPCLNERPPLLHFERNYHYAFAAHDEQRRQDAEIFGMHL